MFKQYIKRLLIETEKAHAQHEKLNLKGVRDKDWVDWYAGYINRYIQCDFADIFRRFTNGM